MKDKKQLIIGMVLIILLGITSISGWTLFILNKKDVEPNNENSNNINNPNDYRILLLDLSKTDNDAKDLDLKTGERISIYVKNSSLQSSIFDNPFLANIEVANLRNAKQDVTENVDEAKYLELHIPEKYYSTSFALTRMSTVTFHLENTTKSRENFKINLKIYNILSAYYEMINGGDYLEVK